MTAVPAISVQISTVEAAGGVPLASIKAKLQEATSEPNIAAKRALLEQAFQVLKGEASKGPLSHELQMQLFALLDNYAFGTWYGQGSAETDGQGNSVDPEEGFRRSACLLELSLVLQLRTLDLLDTPADWAGASSLEELVKSLNYAKGQKGTYHDPFIQFLPAPQVLNAKAQEQGMQDVLAQTLVHLSYSYQNIDLFTEPRNLAFHKKMNDLTEALIGEGTQEALEKLEDFSYNRCLFLLQQEGVEDIQAKIDAYEKVLELTLRAYTANPKKRDSRVAQIENMRALIHARSGVPDALQKAEPHFRKAFDLRMPLLGQFPTDKENFDQHFLLTNTRTGLIKCCLAKNDLEEAKLHASELKVFLTVLEQRDSQHSYSDAYRMLILLVEVAAATSKSSDKE